MTPHNSAKLGDIAKTVLLFGDPVACHHLAHKFLKNVRKVSDVRYACFFTGEYKGKTYTFGTSGMGFGSAGIYIHELYDVYKVDRIIRVGSCGAYWDQLKPKDTVIVKETFSEHPFYSENFYKRRDMQLVKPTWELHSKLVESAKQLGYNVPEVRSQGCDIFYYPQSFDEMKERSQAQVVEMESYVLFFHADHFKKEAACLLTVGTGLYGDIPEIAWDDRTDMRIPSVEIVLNADIAE